MQDADVAPLRLKLPDQGHYPAETTGVAILYGTDTIGVVEVDKCQAAALRFDRRAAGNEGRDTERCH